MHSRYLRQLHDLAVGGRQVLIHLRVRRYFCDVADCGVRTFVTTACPIERRWVEATVVERARADEPSRSQATVACRQSPTDPYVFSPVRTRAAGPMPISRGVSIHAMGEERVGEVPRA